VEDARNIPRGGFGRCKEYSERRMWKMQGIFREEDVEDERNIPRGGCGGCKEYSERRMWKMKGIF